MVVEPEESFRGFVHFHQMTERFARVSEHETLTGIRVRVEQCRPVLSRAPSDGLLEIGHHERQVMNTGGSTDERRSVLLDELDHHVAPPSVGR